MENDAPATKHDLGFSQLRSDMRRQFTDLANRIAAREARVLAAFDTFVESNNQRLATIEGNEAALRSRLGTIEERLTEVEKRLNIPPAA
jgi:uncharacterized protein involved in exopolysaccharide biosynthesis